MHLHAESQDPRFGSTSTNPLTGEQMTASVDERTHVAACLALMQRLNVVHAVVSGGGHHEAVLRWKQRAPEKVLVGYAINDPSKIDPDFLRREHAAGRLRHPKMRLYIMHAGWPFLEETIALMYAHPQVYLDLSSSRSSDPLQSLVGRPGDLGDRVHLERLPQVPGRFPALPELGGNQARVVEHLRLADPHPQGFVHGLLGRRGASAPV